MNWNLSMYQFGILLWRNKMNLYTVILQLAMEKVWCTWNPRLLTDINYSSLSTHRKHQLLNNKEILAWEASLDSRYTQLLENQHLNADELKRITNCMISDFTVFSAFVTEYYEIALQEENMLNKMKIINMISVSATNISTTHKHNTGKQSSCCIL